VTADSPPVFYRYAEGIAEIRFNRPARLNALGTELAEGFSAAVDKAVTEPGLRVIVVSAEGRAFVAGGDLSHFYKTEDKRAAAVDLIGPTHAALKQLADAKAVTIGSLKGAVAGGGMSLALSLDLLVAAEDTVFNFAYPRVGAPVDCGGSWALPRLVGYRKALEIALLSENIDAQQALSLGLVNRVVPNGELEAETTKLAARLASGPPAAQARIKTLMRRSFERGFAEQLDAEAAAFAECAATQDFAEAVAAFIEKRKPQFTGR
jgi:2-(1,2-epoxy-1,2-dihydrophenyl)acetyl-CoA isomerase